MDNFEWDDPSVDAPPNPGCGIIFMGIVFWGMVVLLLAVKTVDYVINQPVSQIQQQLPEYAEVPDYDRRDNSFDMEIIKESSNDVWYEGKREVNEYMANRPSSDYNEGNGDGLIYLQASCTCSAHGK